MLLNKPQQRRWVAPDHIPRRKKIQRPPPPPIVHRRFRHLHDPLPLLPRQQLRSSRRCSSRRKEAHLSGAHFCFQLSAFSFALQAATSRKLNSTCSAGISSRRHSRNPSNVPPSAVANTSASIFVKPSCSTAIPQKTAQLYSPQIQRLPTSPAVKRCIIAGSGLVPWTIGCTLTTRSLLPPAFGRTTSP